MANFFIVVDPDPSRRRAAIEAAEKTLAVFPATHRGGCDAGEFAARWIAGERAPCTVARMPNEAAAILWGDAFDQGTLLAASDVHIRWSGVNGRPTSWDGFHAAISYDSDRGLIAGGDRLGLYPLYYWSTPEIVAVATTPLAFRSHPSFRAALNPTGLCGILLTSGLVAGETVWNGVRRLAPGHLLAWSRVTGCREVAQYALRLVPRAPASPLEEDVARVDAAVERAVIGQVGSVEHVGLLLSGGRDSRTVSGMLHRHARVPDAVTFGEPADHEARGATAVAASLGWPHQVVPDRLDDVEAMVARHLALEELNNGMSSVHTWAMLPALEGIGDRTLSGYLLEAVIGGVWRRLPATGAPPDTDRFLRAMFAFGIAPDRLCLLLRRDVFGDALEQVTERVRAAFMALPGDVHDRTWQYILLHRARYHAGSVLWRLTSRAWPVVVPLGDALLDIAASLPPEALAERRLQDALLRSRFPALARLPLDRNSDDTTPLLPSPLQRFRQAAARSVLALPRRKAENRRYYRLYDINSPFWRAIRRAAEAGRKDAGEYLNARELDALLPPPDVRIELPDAISDAHGLKTLLGFLIWVQRA